jgi:SAM-dependent methyltransferase
MFGSALSRLFKPRSQGAEGPLLGPGKTSPCLVCAAPAPFLDTVDFNKSCLQTTGLPPSARQVHYHQCLVCGFCFAPEFQSWTKEEFETLIYNDDYERVDPDYTGARPLSNAQALDAQFGASKSRLRHLDYGGGAGILSGRLRELGWDSTSYDPFTSPETAIADLGRYDLVTAFEVFEHVPDVPGLMANLDALCKPDGLLVFSTMLSDKQIVQGRRLTWWYAAPRNGHISLFSADSLSRCMASHGMKLGSFSPNLHAAWRRVPDWAAHLGVING